MTVNQVAPAPALAFMPTRQEIADYANAASPERSRPVTVNTVRRWERDGWIKRHHEGTRPVRYITKSVEDFLNGTVTKRRGF